jgi:hypothetical protein
MSDDDLRNVVDGLERLGTLDLARDAEGRYVLTLTAYYPSLFRTAATGVTPGDAVVQLARRLGQAALPGAPVVPHVDPSRRRTGALGGDARRRGQARH